MIEIKNLVMEYPNNKGIYNLSFKIKEGQITAFVGDNGAGKTTTIKSIFNLLPIKNGEITLNGENLFSHHNLQKLAFFPDSNNIPLNLTLLDYIKYLLVLYHMDFAAEKNAIDALLEKFSLTDFKKSYLKNLSAGQKKSAIMVGVLIRRPKYLILDEPTANLDVATKLSFLEIIKDLANEGVAILITSHLIEELQQIATHLILIDNGKIVYDADFDAAKDDLKTIYQNLSSRKAVKKGDISVSSLYETKK